MIRILAITGLLMLLSACASVPPPFSTPNAAGHSLGEAEQCVPYARRISGVNIYGDAGTWWDKARTPYSRGQIPAVGAVLVLSSTAKMPSGHLAVVKTVKGPRQIFVTHSNWGGDRLSRRVVYDSQLVEDISPANDWTNVHFWNYEKNCFGFPYAAKGFIFK